MFLKKKILSKEKVKKNDIVLAIPSDGIHSNGYSLVRSVMKKNKITNKIKKELLKPTKIYTQEVLQLVNRNLIHSAAHITGGGLFENLLRSIPKEFCLNIDLSKIKVTNIFKWLRSKNISEKEMLNTFNCGVGFCLIVSKKNLEEIKKNFSRKYMPYQIGHISSSRNRLIVSNSIKW